MMNIERYIFLIFIGSILAVSGCVNNSNSQVYQIKNETEPTIPDSFVEKTFDYDNYHVPEGKVNFTPLLLPFPIVKSPMPYYVYNESEINAYKYNLTMKNLNIAFAAWENTTKGKVKFYRTYELPENGIVISFVSNIPKDTIGEAGPTYYQKNGYTLIVGGKMKIEPVYGGSENKVLLIHEIGHILGFGHSTSPHSVMYPWNAYSQIITDEIIFTLDILYKDVR